MNGPRRSGKPSSAGATVAQGPLSSGALSEHERMLDPAHPPTPDELAEWMGRRNFARWNALTRFIEEHYPGVFEPRWSFGGKQHGWGLRYHRSKALCTLLPERGRFSVVVVFGAADRAKAERLSSFLTSHVRADYELAPTYPDGKWVRVSIDGAQVLAEVERLLLTKRPSSTATKRQRGSGQIEGRRGRAPSTVSSHRIRRWSQRTPLA
jgi:hypothetical protein